MNIYTETNNNEYYYIIIDNSISGMGFIITKNLNDEIIDELGYEIVIKINKKQSNIINKIVEEALREYKGE